MGLDIHVTDTYFVVAHFHYIMVGGTLMAYLGGIHYWWPKMTGRMYPEGWSKLSALLVFVGFNLTFFPQFILGYQGMPRRYAMYPPEFQVFNVLSTAGRHDPRCRLCVPDGLSALVAEVREGRGDNPFNVKGLEWETTSPPPTFNFDRVPIVTDETHSYAPHQEVKVA